MLNELALLTLDYFGKIIDIAKSNISVKMAAFNQSAVVSSDKMNAKNENFHGQVIETAKIKLPVIYSGVMYYGPGELGNETEFARKGGNVYYPPEALSDPDYIESIHRSAFSVGSHDKNSSEHNRGVDGWPREVAYDSEKKAVILSGYVHGADNVKYVRENNNLSDFGSSAYISFDEVEYKSGISPDGMEYDAIVKKMVNNHLAILPNIRDKKNKIIAMNAMPENLSSKNGGNNMPDEKSKIDEAMLKNAINEAKEKEAKEKEWEDTKNSLK